MSTHDPETEAGAIALCWLQRPAAIFPRLDEQTSAHRQIWWGARSEYERSAYRLQASTVLEAVDEMKGVQYAAAE